MKKDHITLTVPVNGDTEKTGRKSCRRNWNQLSRLQRNIILSLIIALVVILLLLLPGDSVLSETNKPEEHRIQIAPFKNDKNTFDVQTQKNHHKSGTYKSFSYEELATYFDNILAAQKNRSIAVDSGGNGGNAGDGIASSNRQNLNVHNWNIVEFKAFTGPTNDRQRAVVNAFKHAWSGYKEYAWGHDNLKPITKGFHDWFGLGLTIVDSLDTMHIMNLRDEFKEARDWVNSHLTFDIDRDMNLFEVTIRVLGGLLSAYHLTGDKMFKYKAEDLGYRLLPGFKSPSGIPYSDVNLGTKNAHSPKWSPDSSTSEVTTIQLEFRELSRVANSDVFEMVVSRISEHVHQLDKKDGLVPIFINANTGLFRNFATISLGARGDSYYEYLLKQWLQTGKKPDDFLIEDYQLAIDGVIKNLVQKTSKEQHVYVGELINGKDFKPKMDHLTCYLPGTLLLGHMNGQPASHLTLAHDLLETCYQMYMKQPTQLAPEIVYFNLNGESESDIYVKSNDAHNLLRPEFVESLYYFYALTGNETYQDMGWTIFNAFEKYTKVTHGYTSIGNVKNVLNTRPRDMMESFFLGETLKYFYLLFSDNRMEIDLSKVVFNSEAHPLPCYGSN